MNWAFSVLRFIDETIAAIAAIVVGGTAVITVMAVFFRYVMGAALAWPEEIAGYLLVWLTFTGGYLAFRQHKHISFGVVMDMMPRWARRLFGVLNDLILAALFIFMTVYCYRMVSLLGGDRLVTTDIPQGVFMVSILVFSIGGLVHLAVYRFSPDSEQQL
jgi:TRAP-type C4-dicarboxylate transport system permease small subunit